MSEYYGFNAVSASGFKVAKLGQSFFDQLVVYNMMYIVRYTLKDGGTYIAGDGIVPTD